ncbi:MAG: hypothetical protein ACD_20C00434G0008 [uncultured bacterium]|nr:MAG: hypothetical protein ACD_20C00434G0008 [uncultured bacterium]
MIKELSTPVLFLIFNRPDTTQLVFNEIKKVKPKKLYISADGPRSDKYNEAEKKCKQTREIIKQIDWNCEVHTNFSNKNLGCKIGVSSGINWFFDNEEEGIILEDDCIPDQSFFWFCQELLEYYRNDERIMMISGDNFQNGIKRGDGSYYFSRSAHIWGWATWRRAWKYYDVNMNTFSDFLSQNQIKNVFESKVAQEFWVNIFKNIAEGKIDTWDYQWVYTVLSQNGLTILPNTNLITNIGFRDDGTHTRDKDNKLANLKSCSIREINHPSFVLQNVEADNYTFKDHYSRILAKKANPLKKILKKIILNIR